MAAFKYDIHDAIKPYDHKYKNISDYRPRELSAEEANEIETGVEHTFAFLREEEQDKKPYLQDILKNVLKNLPIEYTQGMEDIVSVVVYYFCGNVNEAEWTSTDISAIVNVDELNKGGENEDDEDQIESLKKGMKENIEYDIITRVIIVSTNILMEKYVPLFRDDFKIYMENNKVFVRMMNNRGIKIDSEISIKYMNQTLKWFVSLCDKPETLFTMFSLFISCPTSYPFLALVLFYDNAENKIMITIPDDLVVRMIELEKEFLETQDKMSQKNKTPILLTIAAIGFIAAITIGSFLSKKKEYD